LLRVLVRAGAPRPAGADRPGPAGRQRHGPAQALQGNGDGGGAQIAALALPDGLRDLRGRPGVPPAGRRGLHQPQRAPAQDPRAARPLDVGDPMRVHVALTPADFPGLALEERAAVVVDVLRATTTVVAACAAGCARIVPVSDREAALAAVSRYPV